MTIFETFFESIEVLHTNKLRTGLSALGIIIGIGSVIALMTLGQASQVNIRTQIQSLGTNLLTIRPGTRQEGFLRTGPATSNTLKYTDVEALSSTDRITTISKVAAEYSSRAQVSAGRNNTNVSVTGITQNLFSMRNIQLQIGELITDQHNINKEKVAILGPETAATLFGENTNPMGESIRINGTSFRIIGVTKSKGGIGPFSNDDIVYIPLFTAQKVLFGVDYLSNIYVEAKNEKLMDPALNQVGFFLLELHNKPTPSDADFTIQSQQDILSTITEVTKTFTTLLTGIAAISLVVGGIGIMNIMLVTVTERTSEIGLRKALGAKKKAIIAQFLMESIILTVIGGLIGVIIGLGVSYIITRVMYLPMVMSLQSIVLSVGVSCTIGIIFGWYPAWKASKLQPIEALRYE